MIHFTDFIRTPAIFHYSLIFFLIYACFIIHKKDEENLDLKSEIENKNKEIKEKDKSNQYFQSEIKEKDKEIEKKDKEIGRMKPVFDKYLEYEKYLEFKKNFPQFADSEIITNEEYAKKLQEWINDNDFSKMKLGFSAKINGFDSEIWHSICDNKGKTLIIIKTKDNFIFGGFTQVGWTKDKSKWREEDRNKYYGFIKDSNAFIFSLRNDKGDRKPEKFTIKQGEEKYAIFYYLNYGPTFGTDIFVDSDLKSGYSDFGYSYNLPDRITYGTNEAKSYLAGSYDEWVVDELETYFIEN
ncbi:pep-cterm sorting domain-containing protein [Anaeramoeba ignava]|uniref:Pep-cterm sorting domain-containing protein n=1 Tax=Anaeramoeba ignava TaxID=1746090 RepID=A0A9Q0LAU7_ANAIG|nr:pep-cterm sorting domain-containing protein [Anaeramoeba ignava]